MTKLLGFVGGTVGSYAGWALGEPFGFFAAFVGSTIAFGFGLYAGRRLADHLGA